MRNIVFLIGPPGCGKSVCGTVLAERLDYQFLDTDKLIAHSQGKSISEIFKNSGETYFRNLENNLLSVLENRCPELTAVHPSLVIATGGGMPVFNNNLARLEAMGPVVTLLADVSVLVSRLSSDYSRPLLCPGTSQTDSSTTSSAILEQRLTTLLESRLPVYTRAKYIIDTTALSPEQVASNIITMLGLKDKRVKI